MEVRSMEDWLCTRLAINCQFGFKMLPIVNHELKGKRWMGGKTQLVPKKEHFSISK